jgi:hypothetical protein
MSFNALYYKISVFWDVTHCNLMQIHRYLEGRYCSIFRFEKYAKPATSRKHTKSTAASFETSVSSITLHGAVLQMMAFFTVTAVKDRLCGLVVRVVGYRSRGPEFDSRRYHSAS